MSRFNDLKPKFDSTAGTLSIGDLSKLTGVKIVTIRYYESLRLIPRPPIGQSKHRRYTDDYVNHIKLIRAARNAGLGLDEIKDFFKFMRGFNPPTKELMTELRNAVTEVDRRLRQLQEIKTVLRSVMENPTQDLC